MSRRRKSWVNPTPQMRRERDARLARRNYQIAVQRRKYQRAFGRMVRDRLLAQVVPSPVRRVHRIRKQYVRQQIGKRPRPERYRSVLRLVVHPSDCTRRKNFKKTMMRKLAAQVVAKSGFGGAMRWRRRLKRGQASNTPNPC